MKIMFGPSDNATYLFGRRLETINPKHGGRDGGFVRWRKPGYTCAELMADDVDIPSSLCHCSDRQAVHVHCYCGVCNGKAVNYRTQISHLKLSASSNGTKRIRTEEQHEGVLAASISCDGDGTEVIGKLGNIVNKLKRSCK